MAQEERHEGHCVLHLAFDIAKITLKAASVAAAILAVREIHKVHKAIEDHKK